MAGKLDDIDKIIKYHNEAMKLLHEKKDYKKVEKYLKKVIKYFEKKGFSKKEKIYLLNAYKTLAIDIYANYHKNWENVQLYLSKYLSYDKKFEFSPRVYFYYAFSQVKLKSYELAYSNLKRAYRLARKQNNYLIMIYTLNELSNLYYFNKKYKTSLRIKFIALNLLRRVEALLEEKKVEGLYAFLYHDIGSTYAELKKYKLTFEYLDKFFEYSDILDNFYIFSGYLSALNFAIDDKNEENIKKYFNKLIKLKEKLKDIDLRTKEDFYKTVCKYHENKKDYKKAFEYYQKYIKIKKEILEIENKKNIYELQVKFEVEKKKQERKIYALENKKLKKINLSKDRFFSIVAHDLRSPFATISSFISLMKKNQKYLTKEKIKELLIELEKVVINTYSLLENLLEWSRLQSGVLNYTPTKFDICALLEELIAIYLQNAIQKGIDLTYQCDDNVTVYADKFMISAIIRNFINNAIKFTPINGKIEIYSKRDNEQVTIGVKDSGIGMTEEEVEKLFKLETTFSKLGTNNEKGTGLGLILCKEFAKKNKADIKVKSEKGVGSIFEIKLKIVK